MSFANDGTVVVEKPKVSLYVIGRNSSEKSTPIANLYEYMGKYNPVEKLYTSICKQIIDAH